MILLLFALAVIGMTTVLVNGSIFDDDHLGWRSRVRNKLGKYGDLVDCRVCTGWWTGLLLGISLLSWWNPLIFLPAAFAGSGLMSIYNIIVTFLESKTEFVLVDNNESTEQPTSQETTS